jgi:hypothetical protein
MLLGAKTWTLLKTVPMLFSALSVLGAYLWASGRRGHVFAAAVALLVGISSATIDASHWVLSDPTFVAFTLFGLWALERSGRASSDAEPTKPATDPPPDSSTHAAARRTALYAVLGGACVLLAYFTRQAGLPLLIAAGLWFTLGRRWRALAAYAVAAGIPIFLWWLRTQRVGQATYMGEFWLVDPYDPSLGRIGVGGLVGRFGDNLIGYVTRFIPGGIVGGQTTWAVLVGVLLALLALWGWTVAVTRKVGVAELFLPLYLGLILLWPVVWSGDRFALPIYPLLFFYAGEGLVSALSRWGKPTIVAAALIGSAAVAVPAFGYWTRSVSTARVCASAARVAGPYACWGAGVNEFVRTALWSRSALPPGSAVLSRKPSIFYVMSGVPSRTFPFSTDPAVLFAEVRNTGAHYLVVDQWDRQAFTYMGEVISQRPEAFCAVGGFDPREGSVGTLLLGIRPDTPRPAVDAPPIQISLERCPPEMLAAGAAAPIPSYSSSSVPLLSGWEPAP